MTFRAAGYQAFGSGQEKTATSRGYTGLDSDSEGVQIPVSRYTHEFIGERLKSMRFELAG